MKRLKSKLDRYHAANLEHYGNVRREAERVEAESKAYFKERLAEDGAAEVGEFLITQDRKKRRGLSKELLSEALGARLSEFETETEYTTLTIRRK